MTPLHNAALSGSLESVSILIDAGANLEAGSTTPAALLLENATPLHVAAFNRNFDIVKQLIDAGSNLEAKNRYF